MLSNTRDSRLQCEEAATCASAWIYACIMNPLKERRRHHLADRVLAWSTRASHAEKDAIRKVHPDTGSGSEPTAAAPAGSAPVFVALCAPVVIVRWRREASPATRGRTSAGVGVSQAARESAREATRRQRERERGHRRRGWAPAGWRKL